MSPDDLANRREFIRSSGRCAGLGGLASLLIAGELKRRRLANRADCIRLYTCADCVEFHGCSRSKAEQFRASRV